MRKLLPITLLLAATIAAPAHAASLVVSGPTSAGTFSLTGQPLSAFGADGGEVAAAHGIIAVAGAKRIAVRDARTLAVEKVIARGGHVAAGDLDGDRRPDVIAAENGTVTVYQDGRTTTRAFQPFGGADGPIAATDVDRDGHTDIVAASGSFVKVFSGADGTLLRYFNVGTTVRALAAGEGLIATGGAGSSVALFDATGKVAFFPPGPTKALAIGDGMIIHVSPSGLVRAYDKDTFALKLSFAPFTDVTGVAML